MMMTVLKCEVMVYFSLRLPPKPCVIMPRLMTRIRLEMAVLALFTAPDILVQVTQGFRRR